MSDASSRWYTSWGQIGRLHICGNTSRILADMLASGAEIIDLDWMVDIRQAAEIFGGRIACAETSTRWL
jgi:uroporphyrinogen decarboxylase